MREPIYVMTIMTYLASDSLLRATCLFSSDSSVAFVALGRLERRVESADPPFLALELRSVTRLETFKREQFTNSYASTSTLSVAVNKIAETRFS